MRPHPLDDLLEAWESSTGRAAPDLRLRVYRALAAPRNWTLDTLRDTLRSLLAFGPDEHDRFDELFDASFSDPELPAWLREGLDEHPPDPALALTQLDAWLRRPLTPSESPRVVEVSTPPPPVSSKPPPKPPRVWWRLLLGVLAVTVALWWATRPPPALPVPRPVADAAVVVADAAEIPAPPDDPDAPEVRHRSAAPTLAATIVEERPGSFVTRLTLATLAVLCFALLAELAWRWFSTRPVVLPAVRDPPPTCDARTPTERQLDLRVFERVPPLSREVCEALADRTGFSRDAQRVALSLGETVDATARAGGLFEPVYRPMRRPSSLRVVTPEALDPFAEAVVDAFYQGLKALGVDVTRATGGPERGRGDLTLVVVDARHASDPPVDRWARVGHVAFLEARDPALWGSEVERLPCGVFPLTVEGLGAALDAARRDRLPPKVSPRASGSPRDRLGNAYELARAFAATGPADVLALDALRREFAPHLDVVAMQRVVALEGVRGDPASWWCEAALRDELLRGLRRTSPLWQRYCDWQAARIERSTPPARSRAARERRIALLLERWRRDGTLPAEAYEELRVLRSHPALGVILRRRAHDLARPADPLRAKDRREAAVQEELGLVKKAPDPRPPRHVEWRWAAAAALSVAVIAVAALRVRRERPARALLWVGPPSAVVGVAEGRESVSRCQGGAALVGVLPGRRASCGRLLLHRAGGDVATSIDAHVTGAAELALCRDGAAVVALSGDVHRSRGILQWEVTCARPSSDGTWRVVGGSPPQFEAARALGMPAAEMKRFALRCGPRSFVYAVHFQEGADGALSGLRVSCAALTAPQRRIGAGVDARLMSVLRLGGATTVAARAP